jgi:hypothetical protein
MLGAFFVLLLASYFAVPVLIVWGWIRYFSKQDKLKTFPLISCVGLALATASGFLVVGTAVFARVTGGFAYYDPGLKWVFRLGILLTAASIVLSLIGIWRKSSLRWHAPTCSIGMAVIWLYLFAAE